MSKKELDLLTSNHICGNMVEGLFQNMNMMILCVIISHPANQVQKEKKQT